MVFHSFQNNYHDSRIYGIHVGPRREVTLDVLLDSVWNKGGPSVAKLRFGGVVNYPEVSAFFLRIPEPSEGKAVEEIIGIKKIGKRSWIVDLCPAGAITIECAHMDET